MMRVIALAAACLAGAGRARRMQLDVEGMRGRPSHRQNDTKEFGCAPLGQVLTALEKTRHQLIFDLGSVVDALNADVPAILHKEPHWNIFTKDFQISDANMNTLFEGLPQGKMLSKLLRELRKKFVVNQTIQIHSVGGLEEPYDPFVVATCHLQLGDEKHLLKLWQHRDVIVDIQAKTTFRFNSINQVEQMTIDELLVNGEKLLPDQLSDWRLSDDSATDVERMKSWISAQKVVSSDGTPKASEIGLQMFLVQTDNSSLEFANYCNACGRSQHACIQGKARGRCSRAPWSVNEGCERSADCSKVLPNGQTQRAVSSSPLGGARRLVSGDCRRCLKECLGGPIQKAQLLSMKMQAPMGLVYAMVLKNRPMKMWPLQPILKELATLNPLFYGVAGAGVYMSCRSHCELECPYPGMPRDGPLRLPELENVNPNDISFVQKLYEGGRSSGGEFSQAFRQIFSVPGL